MADKFYVYLLVDPRTNLPFYVGKGLGNRAEDHLLRADSSEKSSRIDDIRSQGLEPHIEYFARNLEEIEAYRIEAYLIGLLRRLLPSDKSLSNKATPSGARHASNALLNLTSKELELSHNGLTLLKEAVLSFIRLNPGGVTNAQVALELSLKSSHLGAATDYLSYSLLGILLADGVIRKEGRLYKLVSR